MRARESQSVVDATEVAIKAAEHLTEMDAGAVAALRRLARLIDQPVVPNDNVSVPTYLKYCESLGLTPAGRLKLAAVEKKPEASGGSTLAKLRSVAGGKSS